MQRAAERRGVVPKFRQQANTSGTEAEEVRVVAESRREERCSPKVKAAGQRIRRGSVSGLQYHIKAEDVYGRCSEIGSRARVVRVGSRSAQRVVLRRLARL